MRCIGKLSRDKRGIGSLVGASFLILILVTGFAFYLLNLRTTEHYDQTLQEMNELDSDRIREEIVIEEVVVTDAHKLNVTVKNEGPISSHLIWLGVYNDTLPPQYYELDRQVNPAETETDIGLTEMGDGAVFEGNQYTIQVVTELGNVAVYSYSPEEESWFPPPEYFGVFSLDWFYFEYTSADHPEPVRAGAISKGDESYVAFHIRVTNNWNEPTTILGRSLINFITVIKVGPGQPEPIFYIVKSVDYIASPPVINAYDDADPITVGPHKSEDLTFAALEAYGGGDDVWKWGESWPIEPSKDLPETALVMIGLVFTMADSPEIQAQTLPFRAVFLDE